MNETFLQCLCITAWERFGHLRFIHHITNVAQISRFNFLEWENCNQLYKLEPIPLSAIHTIASMRCSSHSPWCRQGIGTHVRRYNDYVYFALNKIVNQTMILWYHALHSIIFRFAFTHCQSQYGLSIATLVIKILEHQESLLNSTYTTQNCFISRRSHMS